MYYDSMIAKLIVHGADRTEAIAKMREALNGFVIRGIASNIPFQAALLAHPRFVAGDFNTGFIAEHFAAGLHRRPHAARRSRFPGRAGGRGQPPRWTRRRASAARCAGHELKIGEACGRGADDATASAPTRRRRCRSRGDVVPGDRSSASAHASRIDQHAAATSRTAGTPRQAVHAQVERRRPRAIRVAHNGAPGRGAGALAARRRAAGADAVQGAAGHERFLLSPMPGLLVDVAVQPGQKVRAGERLAVIEAMKMENILAAVRRRGREVLATKGESLAVDQSSSSSRAPGRRSERRRRTIDRSPSWASSRSPSAGRTRRRCARCGSTCSASRSTGTFAASARTSTRTSARSAAAPTKVEVDLMQPLDPDKKPAVHATPLNHVGLWIDDLPAAVAWLSGARRALRARRHPQGRGRPRHLLRPPQGQRGVPDRRRRRADRAGAGAAGGGGGLRQGR